MKKNSLEKKLLNGWKRLNGYNGYGVCNAYIKDKYIIFSNSFEWCIKTEEHGVYAKTYKDLEKAIDYIEKKLNK